MPPIPIEETKQRIQLVDALRGFALLGIVLFHNLEHFNFWHDPSFNPLWLQPIDKWVFSILQLIFSGKAYGIFCILFGFSFWVQYANQKARGNHFAGRFAWRMVLLICFGVFHGIFYNGDILTLYAVLGFILILTRKWSNKATLILATILLLQPVDWIRFLIAFQDPNWTMSHPSWEFNGLLSDARINGPWWKMLWQNFTFGQLSNVCWIWNFGRICQAAGLFLVGMTLSRKQMFSDIKPAFWIKLTGISFLLLMPIIWIKNYLLTEVILSGHAALADVILSLYVFLPETLILLSLLILAWHYSSCLRRCLGTLAPYGRMSLTNYITQSIIGTTLCFGYGFGLYYGSTLSACIGLMIVLGQVLFSNWWLHRHKQGPFEWLWKKGTWIGSKNRPKTLTDFIKK